MKETLLMLCTVAGTVYGQLVFKWQAGTLQLGEGPWGALKSLALFVFRPWMLSAFAALLAGALCWLVALKHTPLTRAYVYVGLMFALVMVSGAFFFREPLGPARIVGSVLIIAGVLIAGR